MKSSSLLELALSSKHIKHEIGGMGVVLKAHAALKKIAPEWMTTTPSLLSHILTLADTEEKIESMLAAAGARWATKADSDGIEESARDFLRRLVGAPIPVGPPVFDPAYPLCTTTGCLTHPTRYRGYRPITLTPRSK